jgi:ABC-type microcin C transport system permease subunit YejB
LFSLFELVADLLSKVGARIARSIMKTPSTLFDKLHKNRFLLMFKGYADLEFLESYRSDKSPFLQYLDEFSKALASEVRMLLGEVGKLREERRALQQYVIFQP